MFKRLFGRKNQKDVRFLPYEDYRTISKNKPANDEEITSKWVSARDALTVNIEYCDSENNPILTINQFLGTCQATSTNDVDEFIRVEETQDKPFYGTRRSELKNKLADDDFTSSLGVFSDTKMYSALISSELKQHNINLKYFNHPKKFHASDYTFFDSITAWIVFLSEDADDKFLDLFIERYIDKPCLFLFAKGNRKKTEHKVRRFLLDHNLVLDEYSKTEV